MKKQVSRTKLCLKSEAIRVLRYAEISLAAGGGTIESHGQSYCGECPLSVDDICGGVASKVVCAV